MNPWPSDPWLIIGCMSGTSCDGIDAVAVAWDVQLRPRLLAGASQDLDGLGAELRAFASGAALSAAAIARLSQDLAEAHAALITQLRQDLPQPPQLLAVHGQTVYHAPPLSWQLLNLPLLAARCGLPVVGDLRAADVAAGGQGAPITPIADSELFPGNGRRAVVNIGGFVNYTMLDGGRVTAAADLCVGNQLLDAAARECLRRDYDDNGLVAASGQVHGPARDQLQGLLCAQHHGRSLGSGDERQPWLDTWQGQLSAADLLASACAALAGGIIHTLAPLRPQQLWISGGGAHNAALMQQLVTIGAENNITVASSQTAGVPVHWREAAAMAILARRCALGQPITLPTVTGCHAAPRRAGTWVLP